MTDKYKEFKKWLENETIYMFYQNYQIDDETGKTHPYPTIITPDIVFREFEKELEENENKKTFKEIVLRNIGNKQGTHFCINIDDMYDELKEKGLLK